MRAEPLPTFLGHPTIQRGTPADIREGDNCRARVPMHCSRFHQADYRILCCIVKEICGPILRLETASRKDLISAKREDILEVWRRVKS